MIIEDLEKEISKVVGEISGIECDINSQRSYLDGVNAAIQTIKNQETSSVNEAEISHSHVLLLEKILEGGMIKICDFERELESKKSFLSGLEKAKKLSEKAQKTASNLRAGSILDQSVKLIKENGAPMHINDLLQGLGKEVNKKNKTSLTGSIGSYARRNQIFIRTAPNTFGLVDQQTDIFN